MADAAGTTDNPYGIGSLWTQSDFLGKALFVILIVMSLYSWYVIFTKALDQRALRKYALAAEKDFWAASSLQDGIGRLKGGDDNPFRGIAADGIQSLEHHERNKGRLTENIDLHDWISSHLQRRVDLVNGDLSKGMSVLASVGSTAPFVGLLGTVWGIYHALVGISLAGSISIDKVSGPVGEALIMTAAGLAVAIPAVLAYNVFGKWIGACEAELEGFAHDLREMVLDRHRDS